MPSVTEQVFMAEFERRHSLPIINVKGTYYDVGYDIGRTFSSFIQTFLKTNEFLNMEYLPLYETKEGREVYEETLLAVRNKYPQYIRELQGLADGANVPFYKLFLIHLDDVILGFKEQSTNIGQGCSTVLINQKNQKLIAHTEDGLATAINSLYIVNVHITESSPPEIFTAFCYPGLLPGYSMGFNNYFAFSVNIIAARYTPSGCIPRTFITRAMFAADSLASVEEILRCPGTGIADAMSLNVMTLKGDLEDSLMYNIEVGPNYPKTNESAVSTSKLDSGNSYFHANGFLRLELPEHDFLVKTSVDRHQTVKGLPDPTNLCEALNIVGDTTDPGCCRIFRDKQNDLIKTLVVGIFNRASKTWSIYMDNPKTCEPLVVIPMKASTI